MKKGNAVRFKLFVVLESLSFSESPVKRKDMHKKREYTNKQHIFTKKQRMQDIVNARTAVDQSVENLRTEVMALRGRYISE